MQRIRILSFLLLLSVQSIAQQSFETNMLFGGNSIDEPKDLAISPNHSFLYFGAVSSSTDGDVPSNAGSSDFWIMKRNINGTPVWSKTYGGPGSDDLCTVMPHPDGGVLAFGTTHTDQGSFGDITGLSGGWLMRTNASGTLIDGKIFGGNITETAVDAFRHVSGNITMVLEAGSTMLNGQTNNGLIDVWIVQVSPTFNIIWSALIGGTGSDVPVSVTSDINGNVYVAATSNSNLPGLTPNKGGTDVWVIKLGPNGNILWQKTFGGSDNDEASDILIHPNGSVYVLAQSKSSDGDFDANDGLNDIWMIKLADNDGAPLGFSKYGGSGNELNSHLDVFGNDHIVVTSSTTSNDNDLTGNKGFSDVWIFTTDLNGAVVNQMNYGGSQNDFATDIITLDSVFHVLSGSFSADKNVPFNTLSQQDLWYYTLNTRPDSCSDQFLCIQDSTLNNYLYPPATDVLICVSGCNAGFGPGPQFVNGTCPDFDHPTAYFYVTTDTTADLLTLSVTSNDFNAPQLALLKSVNCVSFQQVKCATGANGSVLLSYIDIDPLATYVVAISDAEGNIGDFELCATSIDVTFCNEDDRIFVTHTSQGSPLNGPYKPGEEVQICYELRDWNKLDCNGFQGLVPTFGPGWDATWFDLFGQPTHIDSMIAPVEEGFWAWYKVGDVRYNVSNPINGYDGGQGMPPGWYFTNTGDPPPADNPDQTTGDINSCLPTSDKWEVCFTLRVVDECETNLDCSVSMKTFADGEIGINPSLACAYDQEEVFTANMVCCLNPSIQAIQDFSLCSGDTIAFQPETNLLGEVTYTWTASQDPFVHGATSGTNLNQFYQILTNEAVIPLNARYSIRAQANGCQTGIENFEITVLPEPTSRITLSGPNIVCSGSTVTLNFESTGTPPFSIGLYRDNEFFANILSETNVLSIPIDPVFSGRFKIGTLSDASCDGVGTGFVNVTVKPISTTIIDTSLCEGGSFLVGTNIYTEPGIYTVTLENGAENNCDSIVILTLNITPSLHETIEDVICQGDTLFVLGQPYTQTTNEEIEYTGLSGCPNYIQLNLLVKDTFTSEIAQTICNGDTLDFEGIQVFEPGSYSHVVESHPGCFLETILNLTVLPVIVINDLAIIGDNGFDNGAILVEIVGGTPPFTYLWSSGQTTESLFNIKHGDYTLTVTDQQGCDQIFTFEVPFINGTQDASKENNTLNVWPTILSTKDYIEVINTHTKPVRVASVAWCTLNGETFNALHETTIEAGSEHSIKIPESFAQGLYYLKISLTDGSSQSFKVVIR